MVMAVITMVMALITMVMAVLLASHETSLWNVNQLDGAAHSTQVAPNVLMAS
jgi:hypothetical protein